MNNMVRDIIVNIYNNNENPANNLKYIVNPPKIMVVINIEMTHNDSMINKDLYIFCVQFESANDVPLNI